MIRARLPAHIHIFAQLNIALRAQNCQPTIAPIGQGIRREPIHTNIARSPIAAQTNLPEILQLRILQVCIICGERMHHFSHL